MAEGASERGAGAPPRVRTGARWLLGERGARLELAVPALPGGEPLELVIDLYDASRPIHPEGHLGYWKRETRGDERAVLTLDLEVPPGNEARLEPGPFTDRWRNPELAAQAVETFALHLVLHRVDQPASLLSETLVPWYRSRAAWERGEAQRAALFATPTHVRALAAPRLALAPGARVHVAAPDVRAGDAVGNLAIDVARWLRLHGVASQLWARHSDLVAAGAILPLADLASEARPDDLVFYQYSIGDSLLGGVLACPGPKVAFYQGITPPELTGGFEPGAAAECARGLAELPRLAGFDALLAGSRATAEELREALGEAPAAGRIHVCPPTLNLGRFRDVESESVALPEGRWLLYVGRFAPHKRLEDLVDALACYRRLDPACGLVLAGSGGERGYRAHVQARIAAHGLAGHVHWLERPSDGQLAVAYARCTAYVSASRHEGFGIPLVEAMGFGKPVLAHAAPAVRDTLGGAGVLSDEPDAEKLAAAWHATLSDPVAVRRVLAAQDARFAELLRAADGTILAEALALALAPPGGGAG